MSDECDCESDPLESVYCFTHYLSMDRCRHGNYRVSTIYIDTIYRSRVTLGYGGASVEVAVALLCEFGPGAHWHRVRSLRGQPCG